MRLRQGNARGWLDVALVSAVTPTAVWFLAALAAGCEGNSMLKPPPTASCMPLTTFEFAYVLNQNQVSGYTINSCTGAMTATTQGAVSTGLDPENMVVDPLGRFAYAANLVSNAQDLATISMYTIDPSTGVLTPTTPATVGTGFFPQGIGIDPSGKFVYTANSDDNTVSMFTINQSTGVLTPTTPSSVPTGWSPLSITVHPSGKFAYAANQDDDTVSMYSVNPSTGVLTPTTPATVLTGGSPFGVTIDPSGKFAYVPNAYANNTVSQYAVDPNTGILTPDTNPSAPTGNNPTCVAVDLSGKFAYITNRQDNTLSMYTIDPSTGELTPLSASAVLTGATPFRVTVDPTGKFVYVANESGTVSIYTINSDGTLMASGLADSPTEALAIAVAPAK